MAAAAMTATHRILMALAMSAVAPLAAAEPRGDDLTATLENGRGPVVEAPLAPAPQVDATNPDAGAAPEAQSAAPAAAPPRGNPLWAIPLSSLAATRDRPLFSPSRRPPPPVVLAAPKAPPAPAPVLVAARPPEPEKPPMKLIGTILSPDKSFAIFLNEATRQVTQVKEGDEESGWRLREVSERSAVVQKDAQIVTLDLPRPGDDVSGPGVANLPAAEAAPIAQPVAPQALPNGARPSGAPAAPHSRPAPSAGDDDSQL